MLRRNFLQSGALAVTAATVDKLAGATKRRQFVLENKHLAWQLNGTHDGIRSVAFENRLSGHRYHLETENEFKLTFSTGQRLEIPWWNFRLTDGEEVSSEREDGLRLGFHKLASPGENWTPVHNLAGGQRDVPTRASVGFVTNLPCPKKPGPVICSSSSEGMTNKIGTSIGFI